MKERNEMVTKINFQITKVLWTIMKTIKAITTNNILNKQYGSGMIKKKPISLSIE